jgi:hypothetical protein
VEYRYKDGRKSLKPGLKRHQIFLNVFIKGFNKGFNNFRRRCSTAPHSGFARGLDAAPDASLSRRHAEPPPEPLARAAAHEADRRLREDGPVTERGGLQREIPTNLFRKNCYVKAKEGEASITTATLWASEEEPSASFALSSSHLPTSIFVEAMARRKDLFRPPKFLLNTTDAGTQAGTASSAVR